MNGLSKNSYSVYRQSLYNFLDGIGMDRSLYDITGFDFSATKRGVSKKKKSYPEAIRKDVLEYLAENGRQTKVDEFIKLHLLIGPYIGVRLTEYLSIEILSDDNESELTIKIRNGKKNHVRGNGDFRTIKVPFKIASPVNGDELDLKDLLFEMRSLLAKEVDIITIFDDEDSIEDKKKSMMKFLMLAANRHRKILDSASVVRGRKPKLSSTRHQFKIGLSVADDEIGVAAAMGHSSVGTHLRHYGDRRSDLGIKKNDTKFYKNLSATEESKSLVLNRKVAKNPMHVEDRIILKGAGTT